MLSMNEIMTAVQEYKGVADYSLEMIACDHNHPFTAYFDSLPELEEMLEDNDISANPMRLHVGEDSYPISTMAELTKYFEILNHPQTDAERMKVYMELIENHHADLDSVIKYFEDNRVCKFENNEQFGKEIASLNEIITSDLIRKYFNFEQYGKDMLNEYPVLAGYAFHS